MSAEPLAKKSLSVSTRTCRPRPSTRVEILVLRPCRAAYASISRLSLRKSSSSSLAADMPAPLPNRPPWTCWRFGLGSDAADVRTWSEPPLSLIERPPGSTRPENASCSERCRSLNFEMFTEEIENRTMNSAISSVIMSA
jgi:hypothetical protein